MRRRSNRYERKQRRQQQERRAEMLVARRASRLITAMIDRAFRTRDLSGRYDFRVWGDRAVDALSRARRALDEAQRYAAR